MIPFLVLFLFAGLGAWLIAEAYHWSGAGSEPPDMADRPPVLLLVLSGVVGLVLVLVAFLVAVRRLK